MFSKKKYDANHSFGKTKINDHFFFLSSHKILVNLKTKVLNIVPNTFIRISVELTHKSNHCVEFKTINSVLNVERLGSIEEQLRKRL